MRLIEKLSRVLNSVHTKHNAVMIPNTTSVIVVPIKKRSYQLHVPVAQQAVHSYILHYSSILLHTRGWVLYGLINYYNSETYL